MSVRHHVLAAYGTRPEIIKLAPVVEAMRSAGHRVSVVDTGQHGDPAMNDTIAASLGLAPDRRFELPTQRVDRAGALHADALGAVDDLDPEIVLALGDTNTVPAYALAARASGVPFAHLEAGLRSFNQRSMEETNRRVAAACAQLHFAPTERAARFLRGEGVDSQRIFVVGNSAIDALVRRGLRRRPPEARSGVLVTAHRASNVDEPERLERLVALLRTCAREVGSVRFPVHPRTLRRLEEHGLTSALALPGLSITGPVDYDTMIDLVRSARVVLTDSGGLQEEASFFGVPVVLLRSSTPRWEGVEDGSTALTGLASDAAADRALGALLRFSTPDEQKRVAELACPYGDGHTGEAVAALLGDEAISPLLELVEPDYSNGALPWEG